MRKSILLFIFLLLWANVAVAQSVITIEVNGSGNALWTMEKRLPFTKSQINEWEASIKSGQNISQYKVISEFNDTINLFIASSQNFSNRSMEIEEFNSSNISYDTSKTLDGGFGIIRYSFWWKNFSFTNSSKIYVGDAFLDEMVISSATALIIKMPDGYEIQNATPEFDKRDGNRLIWETSYRNFSKGEPNLILSPINRTNVTVVKVPENEPSPLPAIIIISAIVISIAIAFAIIWKRKRSVNVENETGQLTENEASLPTPPDLNEEFLGYEDMIEKFLVKSGGQAFQSDIVKESGLSKSKISIVLAQMKEEGRILKVRKGKENIIRLAKKTEPQN
ncbi:Uncharacterised protein [uncultured archaeon]|nr:Uncharacterised protein [uncultured archaeon]